MNPAIAKRRHNSPNILEVRSLTTADLATLRSGPAHIDPARRIRDRHHHIAWLIALGKPNTDIAAEVRISPMRISVYLRDPAFVELCDRYRAEIAEARREATTDFVNAATDTMVKAERLIVRRLDAALISDDPDDAPALRDLNRIAADRMDRFGYGKHSTSESRNVNVNFAAKLEAAISRSRRIDQ